MNGSRAVLTLLFAAGCIASGVAAARFGEAGRGAPNQAARPLDAARPGGPPTLAHREHAHLQPRAEEVELSSVSPASNQGTSKVLRRSLGEEYGNGLVMVGNTAHRIILFTFDDGPDRRTTPLLLDRLDAAGVRAVFFVTGRRIQNRTAAQRRQRQILQETAARGHIIASHGFDHPHFPHLSDVGVIQELERTETLLEELLGGRPWLFRPPYGHRSARVDRLLAERGYTQVVWNLGAGDFQVRSATEVFKTWQRVMARRARQGQRGGILLLHDTYEWTVDAFQLIIADLLKRNCDLLDQGEELYDFVENPALFFSPRGQASPSASAPEVVLATEQFEERQARIRAETLQRCRTLARLNR